jgi:Concanavalin A-like lectin/glucanases superfamily
MAVRCNASGERIDITTSLPSEQPLTLMAWVYMTVDRAAPSYILQTGNTAGTAGGYLFVDGSRVLTLQTNSSGYTGTTGSTLATGTWYHVAMTLNGTNVRAFLNGVQDIEIAYATYSLTFGFSLGGNNDFWNGRIACGKLFTAALTADQITLEMRTVRPSGRVLSWGYWPLFGSLTDFSGNSHPWTDPGTVTWEDGPPVGWGAAPYVYGNPAAADPGYGTPYAHDGVKPFSSLWRSARV